MALSEQRRSQLDGIVSKMQSNSESDDNIRFVVNDFKQKYEGEDQAPPQESMGSKVLSAIVPSSNQPLPETFKAPSIGDNGFFQFQGNAERANNPDMALPKPAQVAVGVGRVVGDVLSAPKRALGAAGATLGAESMASGGSFLDRMADPESGLLKGARDALAKSDAPAAAKILGSLGVGVVEDPLSYVAAIVKTAELHNYNAAALPEADKAIKVSDEVAQAASLKNGQKGVNTGEVGGIPFSKAQQIGLSGQEVTPDIARTAQMEARIKSQNSSVWDGFVADQQSALNRKVEGLKAKQGFSDQSPQDLTDNVISKIDQAFETQKVKLKASYDTIERAAAEAPPFDNVALSDAKSAMDQSGVYPIRKDFDANGNAFTEPDFKKYDVKTKTVSESEPGLTNQQKDFYGSQDVNGVPNSTASAGDGSRTEVHFIVQDRIAKDGMDANGVSGKVRDAMIQARKAIDNPTVPYASIKNARSIIGQEIGNIYKGGEGYGYGDLGKLKLAYKKLSNAMEYHIEVSGGGPNGNGAQAVKDWVLADKMFSNKDDFSFLRKVLYGNSEGGTPSADVLRRLTNSGSGRNFDALMKIKSMESDGVIPEGVTQNLQNALFNDIIKRSTRTVNGREVVDGELLLKNTGSIRKEFYNEVFTDDQANDISQLVLEGMAQKMSNKLKILDANPSTADKFIRDAAGSIGFWALLKGGPKGWGKWQLGKLLQKALLTKGDRAATRYIRSVDNKSLISGLWKPGLQSAGLQAGEQAVRSQEQTPSQESPPQDSTGPTLQQDQLETSPQAQ